MQTKQLGLKENWQQFSLLVLVNAFVGGMVGMERSILPQLAEQEFHLAAKTAILSFIVVFGITKALTNYFAGSLANKYGRKKLLVIGWVFALPVPFLLIYAPSWSWIIFANVFLGINQGLAWSSTVVMKIDLVGPKSRGFAMGINEAAGYLAVGVVAFLSASIANSYGIRPYSFYIGILLSVLGLLSSIFLIKDTRGFVQLESEKSTAPLLNNIFKELNRDLGIAKPANGDLSAWTMQGVLLLNATLTVRANQAGSHQKKGWEYFTDAVIKSISEKRENVVFMLWGNYAKQKAACVNRSKHLILDAAHPSPLARTGFSGCGHFSKANEYLIKNNIQPIDWHL
jgi:MFS family permease